MIELSSPELRLIIDPSHGAEILELVDRSSGRQLLGHPPWEAGPPLSGDLDEETWTSRYRGGWQLAAPNAGNRCVVGGDWHGFHGRASVDPWEVLEQSGGHVVVRWTGHGLALTRNVTVIGSTVEIRLAWTATAARVPLIAVEHLCFGRELLDPEVEVVAAAYAHEMSEQDGPLWAPDDAASWPHSRLLTGELENAGKCGLTAPRARFTALSRFRRGEAHIRNASAGIGVRIEWDRRKLPFAWLWHEVRATPGIWARDAELLAFEPASVPHSLGLAEAIREGQAHWAELRGCDGYWVRLTLQNA